VLALDSNGHVVEKGSFLELNHPGRYVHSLKVQLQDEKQSEKLDEDNISDKAATRKPAEEEQSLDENRQKGDWATYKYYVKSLGLRSMAFFLFLGAVMSAAGGMQCTRLCIPSRNE
jgi:hypothetical protein